MSRSMNVHLRRLNNIFISLKVTFVLTFAGVNIFAIIINFWSKFPFIVLSKVIKKLMIMKQSDIKGLKLIRMEFGEGKFRKHENGVDIFQRRRQV